MILHYKCQSFLMHMHKEMHGFAMPTHGSAENRYNLVPP